MNKSGISQFGKLKYPPKNRQVTACARLPIMAPMKMFRLRTTKSPFTGPNILGLLLSFSVLTLLFSCAEPQPAEQQILNQLERAKVSVENLNSKDLKEILSPDFEIIGEKTRYDFPLIKKTMFLYSLRKQNINIFLSSTKVTLDQYNSQLASLESTVLITGNQGLLPKDGKLYQMNSRWRLFDDEWKITHLDWK